MAYGIERHLLQSRAKPRYTANHAVADSLDRIIDKQPPLKSCVHLRVVAIEKFNSRAAACDVCPHH